MTTDPTALQERLAEELYYEQHPEGRHRSEWHAAVYPDTVHEYRDLAAAVMSVVAPAIQAAKAEAWDEGHSWGWNDAQDAHDVRQVMDRADWPLKTPNPYRQETDR